MTRVVLRVTLLAHITLSSNMLYAFCPRYSKFSASVAYRNRGFADDPRGCCGRGRVVASDVFPVSLPAAGGATGLVVRAGEFFQMRMPGHALYAGSGRPAGPVCR